MDSPMGIRSRDEQPPVTPRRGKRRRGHGEGSIFRRADGRWAAEVDFGYSGGKRNRTTVYGRTRKEVQEKLDALRLEQRRVSRSAAEAMRSRRCSIGGIRRSSLALRAATARQR
jgi:hypothetical protein